MSEAALHALAEAAGLCVDWTDAAGAARQVAPPTLRAVLEALGHACATPAACRDSLRALEQEAKPPPLRTADVGAPAECGGAPGARYALIDERGATASGRFDARGRAAPVDVPGYYRLEHAGGEQALAVAPARCFGVAQACGEPAPRRWGLALQAYSARGPRDAGIGDAAGAAAWVERVAAAGGDALALSPLHASRRGSAHYSPYSPGDRRFLDPLHAAPALVLRDALADAALAVAGVAAEFDALAREELVDWPRAARARWRWLRALHAGAGRLPDALAQDFDGFVRDGGAALDAYARFAAAEQARSDGGEVAGDGDGGGCAGLHLFAQWLAARSWEGVQAHARAAGMAIGLVADVAVGFDPAGAEAAARPDAVLRGLMLGAPPDAFNADGQVWGVTGYAPAGLRASAFAPWIELLRATMRARGGVRIDHVLGLLRLWVVPAGGAPGDGAYLRYPLDDLLRLLALESWRQRAIVIGEDLGVVPPGLRARLARRGVLGTDVLLFARDEAGAFLPPRRWRTDAVATTTTHDLPTLAGWREGRDLRWRARLAQGQDAVPDADALSERATDVAELRGCVRAELGVDDRGDPDVWLRFVARAPAPLALLPAEDALALDEQPNLPGTVGSHPNWRRRLPDPLPEVLLARRLRAFADARRHDAGADPRGAVS